MKLRKGLYAIHFITKPALSRLQSGYNVTLCCCLVFGYSVPLGNDVTFGYTPASAAA